VCTYQTATLDIAGSGKGSEGWFPVTRASVYLDHPVHAPADHTLNVDLLNPERRRRGACPGPRHLGDARLGTPRAGRAATNLTWAGCSGDGLPLSLALATFEC
jgi:hypothetical protein